MNSSITTTSFTVSKPEVGIDLRGKPNDLTMMMKYGEERRRTPTCSRCKNHGVVNISLRGHKNHCEFIDCRCEPCLKLVKRQRATAAQVFVKRYKETERERRARGLPVRPLPLTLPYKHAPLKGYLDNKEINENRENNEENYYDNHSNDDISEECGEEGDNKDGTDEGVQEDWGKGGVKENWSVRFSKGRREIFTLLFDLYREDPRATSVLISEIIEELSLSVNFYPHAPVCTPPATPPSPRNLSLTNSRSQSEASNLVTSKSVVNTAEKRSQEMRDIDTMDRQISRKNKQSDADAQQTSKSIPSSPFPGLSRGIPAHRMADIQLSLSVLSRFHMHPLVRAAYPGINYLCTTPEAKKTAFSIDHLARSSLQNDTEEGCDWSKIGLVLPMRRPHTNEEMKSISDWSVFLASAPIQAGSFWFQPPRDAAAAAALAKGTAGLAAGAAGLGGISDLPRHLQQLQQLRYTNI